MALYKTLRLLQLFAQLLERDAQGCMQCITILNIRNIGLIGHTLYINNIVRNNFQVCIR